MLFRGIAVALVFDVAPVCDYVPCLRPTNFTATTDMREDDLILRLRLRTVAEIAPVWVARRSGFNSKTCAGTTHHHRGYGHDLAVDFRRGVGPTKGC